MRNMSEDIEIHITTGAHRQVRFNRKRTFQEFEDAEGVEPSLVQRGKNLYHPRSEIPLGKSIDKGFVGNVCTDMQAVMDRLDALQQQLADQRDGFQQQLADQRDGFQQQLTDQRQQLDVVHQQTTIPYVCNAAAQCLTTALGRQRQHKASRVFSDAVAAGGDNGIKSFVKELYGQTAYKQRAAVLDAMMDRRNMQIHPDVDVAPRLASVVETALEYVNHAACVRAACKDEMVVLGKFREDPGLFEPIDAAT